MTGGEIKHDDGTGGAPRAAWRDAVRDRRILIGLSGGIACYKVAHVVSGLVQAGAQVTVAMTESAQRFVGPATFEALSGRPVFLSPWTIVDAHDPQHVKLGASADAMLIAPCTMNMLSKLACGRADDAVSLLASTIAPSSGRLLLAPSMNAAMWAQPATQRNLAQLVDDGFNTVGPDSGWQACRTDGAGRLAEPAELLAALGVACGA